MDDNDDDDSHSQKNHGNGILIHRKKHNFAINISKGGGIGIGVGIILVGGAFLANFFLNKPPKKPTNKKHLQDHSENHTISAENTDIGSDVSREISAHKLFEDGDHEFEKSNGQEDPELTSFSENSEKQAMECNGSVVESDKLLSSAIIDPLLHQPTRGEADVKLVSCIEVNGGGSIDHGYQEKGSKTDTAKHGEDNDESIEDSKMSEFPEADHEENNTSNAEILEENATFEADQGDEDKITIAIQTSEGKGTQGENRLDPEENTAQYDGLIDEVQIDRAREIDLQDSNNGLLTTSDARVLDENELLEEPISGEEPKIPQLEDIEAEFEVETNAETEGIEENKARDNTAGEVVDEKEAQLDVLTNAAETDSSIQHTSKLMEYHVINEAIEDTNDKEIQHDAYTNAVHEAAEIDSNIEHTRELVECQVIEDKEAQHDVHINAVQEAAEIDSSIEHTTESVECQVIEEAIEVEEAQHDVQINAAKIDSGSMQSDEVIDIQTILDQDHSHASHQITTDNISSESSILQVLNPATGLKIDKIDSKDVGIDLHSIEHVTEKDIIYQETDESSHEHLVNSITGENIEDGSQTLPADHVDEISEGSLVQVKDQTDKLQDNKEHVTLQKTAKEIHYKEIEDDDAISSENIQSVNIAKGISNMNFFKNDDEKTSLLMRKRGPIVISTMLALLWPVCYSCLIAILAMVIYKIQGF